MDILLYVCGFLVLAIWLWSSILATIAVRHDATLESLQKKGQTVIVWLFPIVGAVFVLHLIWQHYPEAIPKTWIPWPLKNICLLYTSPSPRDGLLSRMPSSA